MSNSEIQRFIFELYIRKLSFLGISYKDEYFRLWVFSDKKAGIEPIKEHCRDLIDYRYLHDSWRKRGAFVLAISKDYDKVFVDALEAVVGHER